MFSSDYSNHGVRKDRGRVGKQSPEGRIGGKDARPQDRSVMAQR